MHWGIGVFSVKTLVDCFWCKYTTGYLFETTWNGLKIIHKQSMMQIPHQPAWSPFVVPLSRSSSVKTPLSSRKASAMNNFSRNRCCSSALSKALSNEWWWNIASSCIFGKHIVKSTVMCFLGGILTLTDSLGIFVIILLVATRTPICEWRRHSFVKLQ